MTIDVSERVPNWFKLSTLDGPRGTAAEAAKASGLDFDVELQPVGYFNKDLGVWAEIGNRRAVVRRDNGDFMGFVSSKVYTSLQYSDAFNFMDAINPSYVAAATLRGGRQGFMVIETGMTLKVLNGEDPHDLYAILRTSHDCSRGVEVSVMPLRLRCANQLTLRTFSGAASYRWAIKHTTTLKAKLAEAQESIKKIGAYAEVFERNAAKLAKTQLTPDKARRALEIVIPMPKGKTDRVVQQHSAKLEQILSLWTSSPTVAYAGTAWGLVNAVSEHFDWYRPGGTPESRLLNALEGETHKKINKMAGLLLAGF